MSAPCDTSFKARRIEISLLTYLLTYLLMSDTINTFKNRLDAHWKHINFLFHYRATYTVTMD